ncbi:MAG: SGNH/GDSL hydrolase family protein [Actinomycetota bacterium]
MYKRFVAIGDSLTEGVGDPLRDGSLRGWADRLAEGLRRDTADFTYVNLSRRSLRTGEVRVRQLPAALELRPDLSSAIVGMNDLIRPNFEPDDFGDELTEIVSGLTGVGATVLMATFPDISRFMPAPERIRRPLRERLSAASAVVREVAAAHDAALVDACNVDEARNRDVCSIDCLHPNARGHLLLARAFAEALAERSGSSIGMPASVPGAILSLESALHLRWILVNARPQVRGLVRRRKLAEA